MTRRQGIAIGHAAAVADDARVRSQRAQATAERERFEKDRAARRAEVEALIPKPPKPVEPPAPAPEPNKSLYVRTGANRSEIKPPPAPAIPVGASGRAPSGPEVPKSTDDTVTMSRREFQAVTRLIEQTVGQTIEQAKRGKQ